MVSYTLRELTENATMNIATAAITIAWAQSSPFGFWGTIGIGTAGFTLTTYLIGAALELLRNRPDRFGEK